MPSRLHFRSTAFAIGLAAVISGSSPVTSALADDLRIGTQFKLMTLDPQYADLSETNSLLSHIYEHLVNQDANLTVVPQLATSWKQLSGTQWEFKLREGVKFHDGSAFTAEDVIYSIGRVRDFLKPPSGGYQSYTKAIKSVTAPDPLTVVIETATDVPTLPLLLTPIFIMPHKANGFATTDDLNAGVQPVGTGPYKFLSWQSGEELNLTRNDAYWGGKPAWTDVSFRVIESPAACVAALTMFICTEN